MKRLILLLMIPALLALAPAGAAVGQDIDAQLDQLQKRFAARHDTLVKLKDVGKVGETVEGYVAPVAQTYLDEQVPGGGQTIRAFLAEENADRAKLYQLLAKKLGETPEEIAVQNAIRNFKNAAPHHYLRLKDGSWIQKKDVKSRKD